MKTDLTWPAQSEQLETWVRQLSAYKEGSDAFLFAIDGRDGAGKSTLGLFLSLHSGVDFLDQDLFGVPVKGSEVDPAFIRAITRVLARNRPIVVSGVFVARTLALQGMRPHTLIRVIRTDHSGAAGWEREFDEYEQSFRPDQRAFLPCFGAERGDRDCKMLEKVGMETSTSIIGCCTFCEAQSRNESRNNTPWW